MDRSCSVERLEENFKRARCVIENRNYNKEEKRVIVEILAAMTAIDERDRTTNECYTQVTITVVKIKEKATKIRKGY